MMKNLPETPTRMASLLNLVPGQVESIALSRARGTQMTLLSIPEGEAISEEEYRGDVLYLCLEGDLLVNGDLLLPGDCIKQNACSSHAIGTRHGVKYLQIILEDI